MLPLFCSGLMPMVIGISINRMRHSGHTLLRVIGKWPPATVDFASKHSAFHISQILSVKQGFSLFCVD